MGISSSLNASVAGLQANAQRLSGISDNIANSQTNGYKRADTDFGSLVNYGNSASSYNAGGVRAATSREVSTQGSLISTGNSTDISINGRGFIPVTSVTERGEGAATRPFMLTTTGSFSKDDAGFLRTGSGLQLLGWPSDATGVATGTNVSDLEPVNLNGFDFSSNPTTNAELAINLPSNPVAPGVHSINLEYFDQLGNSNDLAIEFTSVNAAAGTWTMTLTDSADGSVVGNLDLDFATAGATAGSLEGVVANTGTYTPATGILTVPASAGGTSIDIQIGTYGSTANLTQFASDFAPVEITKDGSSVGFLETVELNSAGYLEGIYDNGLRRSLYQIPVADVANAGGLSPEDGQAFSISNASGPVKLWNSGDGPTGTLTGYTLEQSTTDITEELTQLIQTQRAYSSNAKIVQTVDEMLQETTNLKR